jgi:hypothetical protein
MFGRSELTESHPLSNPLPKKPSAGSILKKSRLLQLFIILACIAFRE